MAEETQREYKEIIGTLLERPRRHQRTTALASPGRFRPLTREVRVEVALDYSSLKAEIASAVAELKILTEAQHEQTREVVQDAHREVLAAIKASPAAYVKIICEFGALFLVFALALRLILKIELVNSVFAVFSLFSMTVYWLMAHVREKADKRQRQKEQA